MQNFGKLGKVNIVLIPGKISRRIHCRQPVIFIKENVNDSTAPATCSLNGAMHTNQLP